MSASALAAFWLALPWLQAWIGVAATGVLVCAVLLGWAMQTEARRKARKWNGGLSILTGGHVQQYALGVFAFALNLVGSVAVAAFLASPARQAAVVSFLFLGLSAFLAVFVHKWVTWRAVGRYEGVETTERLAVVERRPELGRRKYDKPKPTEEAS